MTIDNGRPYGFEDELEMISVKMIDMGTLKGFRAGFSRILTVCSSIAAVPMLAKMMGRGKRVAIGIVTPDAGTGYTLSLAFIAVLLKSCEHITVEEDKGRARIYIGPDREAELLIVQDESDFDGVIMIGGSVLSNVVDAERVLEQFRLRITEMFPKEEKS
jgi:hypothetical protein